VTVKVLPAYTTKKLGAMLLLCVVAGVVIVGFTTWGVNFLHMPQPPEEERAGIFVEVQLLIINPTASNFEQRPPKFGVVKGEHYIVEFTAEKFMGRLDDRMHMKIDLPEGLQLMSGDLEWSGRDKQHSMQLQFKPIEEGDFIMKGTAINLDTNFSSTMNILVCVRSTADEARRSCQSASGEEGGVVQTLESKFIQNANIQFTSLIVLLHIL